MTDLLVPLHRLDELPRPRPPAGFLVRRAMPYELDAVTAFVAAEFPGWRSECAVAFHRQPPACHLATQLGEVVGFACHDVTARGFFGPIGVSPAHRGRGLGRCLYRRALESLQEAGYGYAIVGGAAPDARKLYLEVPGAWTIPDSDPGIYRDRLNRRG